MLTFYRATNPLSFGLGLCPQQQGPPALEIPSASSPKALHMSYKRTRAQYEADLQKSQSPYVTYGTPLPPLDPDVRDDGSYVPVWKQEVRDERGRKRLHGAFTGGWSAG